MDWIIQYWCLFRMLTVSRAHIVCHVHLPRASIFQLQDSTNSFQNCQSAITSSSEFWIIFLCTFIIFWDTETLKMSCCCQVSRQNVSYERAIRINSSVHTEPWKHQNDRPASCPDRNNRSMENTDPRCQTCLAVNFCLDPLMVNLQSLLFFKVRTATLWCCHS